MSAPTRGAPYHPMTQGKIERCHRSMKAVVKREHYYSPRQLEGSLSDVAPTDVYLGRHHEVVSERDRIK